MEEKLKRLNSGGIIFNIIILIIPVIVLAIGAYDQMTTFIFIRFIFINAGLIVLEIWIIKRARRIYFDSEKVYFKSPFTGKYKEIINISDVISFESTGVHSSAFFYFMLKYSVDGERRWKIFIPNTDNRETFYQLVLSSKAFKKEDDQTWFK